MTYVGFGGKNKCGKFTVFQNYKIILLQILIKKLNHVESSVFVRGSGRRNAEERRGIPSLLIPGIPRLKLQDKHTLFIICFDSFGVTRHHNS